MIGAFARKASLFIGRIVSTYKKHRNEQIVLATVDKCCYNVDIVRIKLVVRMDVLFFISNIWDERHRFWRCLLFA